MSARGVASRRESEKMITEGRVRVNGAPAALGDSADPERDVITVDNVPISKKIEHVYIMLNKPRGCLTAMKDDRGRKTVRDLVTGVPARVYPVGRLDYDSEGLLIMTNDGGAANRLAHPSFGKRKTYIVTVRGDVDAALPLLEAPVTLDDGVVVRAERVVRRGEDSLSITVGEGRNRQIRRMCEQCGLDVRRLVRVAVGGLTLGGLKTGQWRYLSAKEVKGLK